MGIAKTKWHKCCCCEQVKLPYQVITKRLDRENEISMCRKCYDSLGGFGAQEMLWMDEVNKASRMRQKLSGKK